jgi:hypothetical protein
MEFGLLKSKIEKKLLEAYANNTFKKELEKFKKFILEKNDLNQVYYLYNELSKEKNFEKSFAEDYVNECIQIFENIKINNRSYKLVENWLKDTKAKNEYADIDSIFSRNTLMIENKINSKNSIVKRLSSEKKDNEVINIDMEKMLEVANKTIDNYLSQISESEQKEIKKYISLSEEEIKNRYNVLSEIAIERLENMSNDSEDEIKTKISETINKIKSENVDVLSLIRLKSLTNDL